ncbi:hypothetical protein H4219_001214 [Mycoemilia scoparia]|uniref:DnaJ homolog subfamily C member 2 n=1 Tax=Mycoemilia scoparia TaxID=417184 RepID=A0A9W8DVQ4_9FUNG|nr:hypothetical protein H4219_001214 [Mycoemilia scoparia]
MVMLYLPCAPKDITVTACISKLSDPKVIVVEKAGIAYPAYISCLKDNADYLDEDFGKDANDSQASSTPGDDSFVLDEWDTSLLYLDPGQWKDQDHYEVLGISKLRWRATPEQIKRAYRLRVLEHHPDKKAKDGDINDDKFFKCIQRAYAQLYDPILRRQYDSIDPEVDFEIPKPTETGDFFKIYGEVFEREARSNFDSWRSFEYLDEEKERVENRDEKRWHEKKNKAQRQKRKNEDNARIRKLVAQALAQDPRIEKYKNEEKIAKEKKRQEREEASRRAIELDKKRQEEERLKELRLEEEKKKKLEDGKKEKERKKKELRKLRQDVRKIFEDMNYLSLATKEDMRFSQERKMAELNLLLENLDLEETKSFNKDLAKVDGKVTDVDAARATVAQYIGKAVEKIPAVGSGFIIFAPGMDIAAKIRQSKAAKSNAENTDKFSSAKWDANELELLIKATNKFPGGTVNRWTTISKWISHHSGLPERSESELIKRMSELKKGSKTKDGVDVKELQFQKTDTSNLNIKDEATIRYDGPQVAKVPVSSEPKKKSEAKPKVEKQWSTSEQAQLENALRKYPPSWKGEGDRWENIAVMVNGRTKKECKLRVKHLSEMVRQKKSQG